MTFSLKGKIFTAILLVTIILSLYIPFSLHFNNLRTKKMFTKFYRSKICGEISNVTIAHHGVKISIKDHAESFIFYPLSSPLNDYRIFNLTAEKGDSLIKEKYSDTLKLVKNHKVYLFTFEKF